MSLAESGSTQGWPTVRWVGLGADPANLNFEMTVAPGNLLAREPKEAQPEFLTHRNKW
jgi:hypothetical protein